MAEKKEACPNCGSKNVKKSPYGDGYWVCKSCHADWKPKFHAVVAELALSLRRLWAGIFALAR